jgi:triphosphoribosyl-dephospho-CoA synthetase
MRSSSAMWRWAGIVALPVVMACGLGKVSECNKLIQAANGQQQQVHAATGKLQASESPSDVENLASTMENAAKAVGSVELKNAQLTTYRDQYRDLLNNLGKACRDLAAAMRTKNIGQINAARTKLSTVGADESKIISGINGYCSGP